jgi:hypothetical protein
MLSRRYVAPSLRISTLVTHANSDWQDVQSAKRNDLTQDKYHGVGFRRPGWSLERVNHFTEYSFTQLNDTNDEITTRRYKKPVHI